MKTTNGWPTRLGITAAVGATLFLGWLGLAHREDEAPHAGGPGTYGPAGCPMWDGGRRGGPMGGPGTQGTLDMEEAEGLARDYLARYGGNLRIAEIMEFADITWRSGRKTPASARWSFWCGVMAG